MILETKFNSRIKHQNNNNLNKRLHKLHLPLIHHMKFQTLRKLLLLRYSHQCIKLNISPKKRTSTTRTPSLMLNFTLTVPPKTPLKMTGPSRLQQTPPKRRRIKTAIVLRCGEWPSTTLMAKAHRNRHIS